MDYEGDFNQTNAQNSLDPQDYAAPPEAPQAPQRPPQGYAPPQGYVSQQSPQGYAPAPGYYTNLGYAPPPAPKKKKKGCLIAALVVLLAVFLICVISCVAANDGSGSGGSSGGVIVPVSENKLKKAYDTYCLSTYAELGSDGSYLSIDTNPSDIDDYFNNSAYNAIQKVNAYLGLPDSVLKQMGETSALDGRQTQTHNGITVSWKYHPDSGLEVTYTVN